MKCWICGRDGDTRAHRECLDKMNRRRDAGMCTACGERPPEPRDRWCSSCRPPGFPRFPKYRGYGQ